MLKKLEFPKKSLKILVILLCTDLFFVFLHIAHKIARIFDAYPLLEKDIFNIYYDLTLAESFQYVKEYWIIILFGWMIFKEKKFFFSGWWLMFIYLLLDDMFSVHENLGTFSLEIFKVDPWHIIFGELRYQDFGELGVSIFFGIIFFSIIAYSYLRGSQDIRTTFHYLFGWLLLIIFFGVVNDFANRIFEEDADKMMFEITRLIEEAGEMMGVSFMCWYVFSLTEPDPPSAQP